MPRWSDYGNARSQSGRGTLLFRRTWMIQLTRTVRMAICGLRAIDFRHDPDYPSHELTFRVRAWTHATAGLAG